MSDPVQPRGESLRKAVRWLSELEDYGVDAINSAIAKFDLSPIEAEFLIANFLHADRTAAAVDQSKAGAED